MAMDTKPRHMLHMAAKYEFISQSIKTGSFVSLFVSKFKFKMNVVEENDRCPTSVNRKQKSITTVDKPFV